MPEFKTNVRPERETLLQRSSISRSGLPRFLSPPARTPTGRPAGREVWVVGVGSLIEEEPARSATNDGYGQSRQSRQFVALPPSSSLTPLRSLLQLLDNEALF